jgi:hypothetical protein
MSEIVYKWSHEDLAFVVEALVPGKSDPEQVVELLQEDESLLDAMLQDDQLFQQLMDNEQGLVSVSPQFFFKIVLLRARRDLEQELYTIERRHQQRVVLFDANRVVDLIARPEVSDYLAAMLASFTRINSVTIPIRVRRGIWHRLRINDLDVDSLINYAQMLDEEHRFGVYQRIGDACLFLAGIFPEYIEAHQTRFRSSSSLLHDLEDFESYGSTFYRLAAEHKDAQIRELEHVLTILSEQFILAEKPLTYLADRYLALRKHHLFELQGE